MIERPSPNHDLRPPGVPIDILLLHYTGMEYGAAALARLCDPSAKLSAHYLVEEDGTIYRLVPEDRRAWHAGAACWAGARDVNARSIGIELTNPGHEFGYRAFPETQMASLERLAKGIVTRHRIPAARVLGHSDVAPTRKRDPGELFDWARLARIGLGLWPVRHVPAPDAPVPDATVREVQEGLARFGYAVPTTGTYDSATRFVVTAFQRHFRPWRVDGRIDRETCKRLYDLLALFA